MDILYIATFVVAFISSVLSGIAGGGGGFVMAPYWLAVGLAPAQGAAVGSFMATGMSISSLAAFHGTEHFPKNKWLLYVLSATALFGALLGAVIVPKVDVQAFKYLLAVITIAALPLLFIKQNAVHRLTRRGSIGLVLAVVLLIAGSIITSSAFSILFALTLVMFFKMTVLQMIALRRVVGIVQSLVLFVALTMQGYFIWQYAVVGFAGGSLGSYIGTRYTLKQGESFARYALVVMSLTGAFVLLV